ncbi:hypothetical protein C3489_28240 [Streptomyces sp. Ru71]|nr:hypothetical protein C3489_28240 [Streptomyces sp. Ru71]
MPSPQPLQPEWMHVVLPRLAAELADKLPWLSTHPLTQGCWRADLLPDKQVKHAGVIQVRIDLRQQSYLSHLVDHYSGDFQVSSQLVLLLCTPCPAFEVEGRVDTHLAQWDLMRS